MIEILKGFTPVFISLSLVVVAGIISRFLKLGIGWELAVNTVRAFGQLLAIGYLLEYIFSIDNIFLFFLVITVMAIVGGATARSRAPSIPGGFILSAFSILCAAFASIGLMLLIGVITPEPQYIIPLGGMVVGTSMNGSALGMERLYRELKGNRDRVELALCFGATSHSASIDIVRQSIRAGMIPSMNLMKVIGLVQLPGAMTGMILAGASPIEAVKIQIIVAYMIISGVSISTSISVLLARQRFFNKRHQLVLN